MRNLPILILVCIFSISAGYLNLETTGFCQAGDAPAVVREKPVAIKAAIDSILGTEMERLRIPGLVIVVVEGEKPLLAEGYGFADLEKRIPVEPDKTLFRVASVSKLFTATAVLQLQERGLLDVSAPIAPLLGDISLPLKYPEPITLHHLLTHTAGFDMTDIGDAALDVEDLLSLEEKVRSNMVQQVHPPGQFYSYANDGYTLAGYLISQASGVSFAEYMNGEILEPLGMTRSSFSQPASASFEADLAIGYTLDGDYIAQPRDFSNVAPADSMVATGQDMSRFMIALLNDGRIEGKQFLRPETVNLMMRQQFTTGNSPYGMAYGFHENWSMGRRVLDHTGGGLGFVALLQIIPEENLGIFIGQNMRSGRSQGVREQLADAILEILVGEEGESDLAPLSPPDDSRQNAGKFTGVYQKMDYPRSSFEKVSTLLGRFDHEIVVEEGEGGILLIDGEPFVENAANRFAHQNYHVLWKQEFLINEDGKATHLVSGRRSYERVPWYRTYYVIRTALSLSLIVLLLQFIYYPGRWMVRKVWLDKKRRRRDRSDPGRLQRITTGLNSWAGNLILLLCAGLVLHLIIYDDQLSDYGMRLTFKLVLLLGSFGAILGLISPVTTIMLWFKRDASRYTQIAQTILTLSLGTSIYILYCYNMIGI